MDDLELRSRILDRINAELLDSEVQKKAIYKEVRHESTLVATLRLHLYAEKELNEILPVMVLHSESIVNQVFKRKLSLLYSLGVMDKHLFDAISKLNDVRNNFAHKLEYESSSDYYQDLKSGLSGWVLENHKADVKMIELSNGELDDDTKFRIAIAGIWIQLRIFATSIMLKKFEYAKRLEREIKEELDKESTSTDEE
ncbi:MULTISPECIES: hypothetical protein [unclassified Sporosarcina]|uniref:hypothetical protein n=1 Tax=unclassified Sporosarcina TaxID=2647733 RepID=UPI001180A81B|nr:MULTISPECIES: hypothetical protein [unclassified Sporosarcina]